MLSTVRWGEGSHIVAAPTPLPHHCSWGLSGSRAFSSETVPQLPSSLPSSPSLLPLPTTSMTENLGDPLWAVGEKAVKPGFCWKLIESVSSPAVSWARLPGGKACTPPSPAPG
jgi:hypothetical protein